MDIVDVSWSAGFLDGEGCIGLRQSKSRPGKDGRVIYGYYLQVSAGQVDLRPLCKLQALWGGKIQPKQGSWNKPGHRMAWQWNVYGDKARAVLRATLPFLVVKREQAEVALEFEGGRKGFSGRPLPEEERVRREGIRNRLSVLKRVVGDGI